MSLQATFIDVGGVLRKYLNSLTGTLVGTGKPVTAGFHLNHIGSRGGKDHTFGMLVVTGGTGLEVAEGGIGKARVTAQLYGPSQLLASTAAFAYANALGNLDGHPVTPTLGAGTLLGAENVSWPLYAQDRDVPRYLVDCVLLVKP